MTIGGRLFSDVFQETWIINRALSYHTRGPLFASEMKSPSVQHFLDLLNFQILVVAHSQDLQDWFDK